MRVQPAPKQPRGSASLKNMDFKEIKTKSEPELHKALFENRQKIQGLNFKDANKQLKNVRELRSAKRDNARILTVLNANKK